MDWVSIESFRLICPAFADELIWGQPFQSFETAGEVVGIDEVGKMLAQFIVVVIVIAMNGRLFDGAVHAFDLAIGPRMPWFGAPVINVVSGTSTLKGMAPEQLSFRPHLPDISRSPTLPRRIGELNAIVCEYRVDGVGNSGNKIVQKLL